MVLRQVADDEEDMCEDADRIVPSEQQAQHSDDERALLKAPLDFRQNYEVKDEITTSIGFGVPSSLAPFRRPVCKRVMIRK